MPHLWVEYSANLADKVSIPTLLKTVQDSFIGDGRIFPLAGARTRGVRVDDYLIADGHADNAFVHCVMRIAPGRSVADKQAAGQAVFTAVKSLLAPVMASTPLGISVQIEEADEKLNFKISNYRDHLKARGAPGMAAG